MKLFSLIPFFTLCIFCYIFGLTNVAAQPVKIDVSEDVIGISSAFSGRHVTLFGLQKQQGDIVIIVRGPALNKVIREKNNVLGLWLTTKSVHFVGVPGYYSVAASTDLTSLTDIATLKKNQIGLDFLSIRPDKETAYPSLKRYQDALIEKHQLESLFVLRTESLTYITDELFKTKLWFPSNIPVGEYTINAFLFKDQKIIGKDNINMTIKREGFNASLKDFSLQSPWLYALTTIILALLSGWLATVILRRE